MIECLICKKELKNGGVLARHIRLNHYMLYREYFHRFILKCLDTPTCKCGCGKLVSWTGMGYREFVKGHYSRVHNNWGHNPKAIEKSTETRKKQFQNGERQVWNKGLTIEDERVKGNIDVLTEYCRKPEERKNRSIRMKENRLDGTIPTLYGPDSSQWKGGISEINNITRSSKRLYDEWKYPILIRDGFKCVECGENKNLHVHHDKEKMCDIVGKHVLDEEITDFELKKCISDKIVDYHVIHKVSGITLCNECHEKYHPSLNFS